MFGANPEPVPLRDDSVGVSLEETPRMIQEKPTNGGYNVTLNQEWLTQLDIDEQSAATLHSFSSGMAPVIVRNPAIIIQPAAVLDTEGSE